MRQHKLFIAGASGYIGSHLLETASQNFDVRGTSTSGQDGLVRLQLNRAEMFDYDSVASADTVILAAAISSPDISAEGKEHAWNINVIGTIEFLRRVIDRGARVIFLSSDTVYGEIPEAADEQSTCGPIGLYANMKRVVEKYFFEYSNFKSARLSYVFSKQDKFTRYLMNCAKSTKIAQIYHPFYRSIIYRDDVAQGILNLAQKWDEIPHSVINFGGPELMSRHQLAMLLAAAIEPELQLRVVDPGIDFYKNRPATINLVSPWLTTILGRQCISIRDAINIEFNTYEAV